MRLFVAVELSDGLRQEAARVAGTLADAFGPDARRAVAWVAPDKMHLTLRFIGEASSATAKELARRVAEPFGTPAFRLAIDGIGAFPRTGPPRVIWLGITEGAESLAQVHGEIESRLEGLGIEREDRPFRAHLTLGRVRAPVGPAARRALASIRAAEIGSCEVREVTLFESQLSPRGAVYTVLARGRLAG
jgi:RNA 2',3'-cyclic 3'-phosphodiesterase